MDTCPRSQEEEGKLKRRTRTVGLLLGFYISPQKCLFRCEPTEKTLEGWDAGTGLLAEEGGRYSFL